eukprot:4404708-Pyramimonas_sp.AAC.1
MHRRRWRRIGNVGVERIGLHIGPIHRYIGDAARGREGAARTEVGLGKTLLQAATAVRSCEYPGSFAL